MTANYTSFEVRDQGGDRVIVAEPLDDDSDRVKLDGSLAATDDPDGVWTEVVGQLIRANFETVLNLDAGVGTVPREQAVTGLLDVEDAPVPVNSEEEAHAVLNYLIARDILAADGDNILVLKHPAMIETDGPEANMLLNWVAAIEVCVRRIDAVMASTEEWVEAHEVDGDLADADYDPEAAEELSIQIDKLEAARGVLKTKKTRLRQAHKFGDGIDAEDAVEMADSLCVVAADISGDVEIGDDDSREKVSLTNMPTSEGRRDSRDTMEVARQIIDQEGYDPRTGYEDAPDEERE